MKFGLHENFEYFDIGPLNFALFRKGIRSKLYCARNGFPEWDEPFEGETLEDAKRQAAERCITTFEKWAEEARKLCQIEAG